jgi:hypothetical protein
MATQNEVKDLKESLVSYYHVLRNEQRIDETYYRDTFPTTIPAVSKVRRTGNGAKMVDTIIENITASNPQAFRAPRTATDAERDRARRVATLVNNWLKLLVPQIKEAVGYAPYRGEGFFQLDYDADRNIPLVTAPDPMTVYADPVEVNGVPQRVVKYYQTTVAAIKTRYPDFQTDKAPSELVEYFAYWDKDVRYAEADSVPLLAGEEGFQQNIFRRVPFVHFYSGFGKTGMECKPEDKAVGKLRKYRDILSEECEVESQVASIIALWANPYGVFAHTQPDSELGEDPQNIDISPGHNIEVPYGVEFRVVQGTAPPPELFAHLARIQGRLGLETPPVMSGVASGTSGRQEDILASAFRSKYKRITENAEQALETLMGMALEAIDKIPGSLPIEILTVEKAPDGRSLVRPERVTKADIDGYYDVSVKLQVDDAIEKSHKIMLGRTLMGDAGGGKQRISWKYFLVQFCGMPDEDAEDMITDVIAEQAYLSNPMIADMVVREAIEKMGGQKYLRDQQGALTTGLGPNPQQQMVPGLAPPGQGQTPRNMNTQNPVSRDVIDQALRQAPYPVRESPDTLKAG